MNAVIPGVVAGKSLTVVQIFPPYKEDGSYTERVKILTGKRKVSDVLSWSASNEIDETGDFVVNCQGLYKGHYGDAKVKASDLYRFLSENAPFEAFHFMRAWNAWALN